MTVCSPAPLLLDSSAPSNNGGAHVYQPTPVEIHQIQQNPGLWSTSTSSNENDHHMVAAMSATATAAAPPLPPLPMDSPFHQQQLGMAAAIVRSLHSFHSSTHNLSIPLHYRCRIARPISCKTITTTITFQQMPLSPCFPQSQCSNRMPSLNE